MFNAVNFFFFYDCCDFYFPFNNCHIHNCIIYFFYFCHIFYTNHKTNHALNIFYCVIYLFFLNCDLTSHYICGWILYIYDYDDHYVVYYYFYIYYRNNPYHHYINLNLLQR